MSRNSPFSNPSTNNLNDSNLTASRSCPDSSTHYSPNSSTMSAAAAAALLLRAATNSSINGDASVAKPPARRNSASVFVDSVQSPTSFPSVISAAAHHAALAAAHAMGASSSKSSDIQAAVISLALAANPSIASESQSCLYDSNEKNAKAGQSISDFLFLSERHPDIFASHPSLAAIFRKRSSSVLPCYLPEVPTTGESPELLEKSMSNIDNATSRNFISAFELMNSRRNNFSTLLESNSPTGSHQELYLPSQTTSGEMAQTETRPVELDDPFSKGNASYPAYSSSKFSLTNPELERGGSLIGSNEARMHNHAMLAHQTISPTRSSSVNDGTHIPCCSASPMSYSSSNTATQYLNISPMEDQFRSTSLDLIGGDMSMKYRQPPPRPSRAGCLQPNEVKSEYGMLGENKEDSNRKREQRLLKNREAARECRRKKKEYVKCLESRVSVLESQNQQLIEELQKVKALCFNELCALGLNNSTAGCAAAVLAAVTSMSGTSSVPAASLALTNSHDRGLRLSDGGFLPPLNSSENSLQLQQHFLQNSFPRTRRRSVAHSSIFSEVSATGSDDTSFSHAVQYSESECAPSFVCDVSRNASNHRPLGIDSSSTSANLYDSMVSSGGADSGIDIEPGGRATSGSVTPQALLDAPRPGSKRPEMSSTCSTRPNTPTESCHSFMHPTYTTKRPYRIINLDETGATTTFDTLQPPRSDHNGALPVSSSNVTESTTILAAPATMTTTSDTRTEPS